jgi:Na+/H+ antiporter NhaD/arsenite permease-like protein
VSGSPVRFVPTGKRKVPSRKTLHPGGIGHSHRELDSNADAVDLNHTFDQSTGTMRQRYALFVLILLLLTFLVSPSAVFASEAEVHETPAELWMAIPFVLLLASIAIMPFINRHWWERRYPFVAFSLGAMVVLLYLIVLQNSERVVHTANEYFSFIVLIGSLFIVAGGIHIKIRGRSTPHSNVLLLLIGGITANLLGTTGASMVLIRPYLRVNRYRLRTYHVVFFIFVVSNVGGALTPIGDPPLFLGYLRGIPFFWVVQNVWHIWAVAMAILLLVFYLIDRRYYIHLTRTVREVAEHTGEEAELAGPHNIIFLLAILGAVFIQRPPFVREAIMITAAMGSYFTTKNEIHKKNDFNFHPIQEVAILFAGIFATMIPALQWLEANARLIGIQSPGQFYWGCGILSSVLDNAPTYLNYLSASVGLFVNHEMVAQIQNLIASHGAGAAAISGAHAEEIRNTFGTLMTYHADLVNTGSVPIDDIHVSYLLGNHPIYIMAISISAVFFGACTYIGNGPNFMVKSIAEHSGAHSPSFFGYVVRYTLPILIPTYVLVWLLFFHNV